MVAAAVPTAELQAGIYFRRINRKPPPPAFALMLFAVNPRNKGTERVQQLFEALWKLYGQLNSGIVPDLGPDYKVPFDPQHPVDVLFGFGAGAFELSGTQPVPAALAFDFEPPLPGKMIAAFHGTQQPDINGTGEQSGICYARGALPPRADFALQFTGPTPFRVERAVVETWKQLHDFEPGPAPLKVVGVFTGTQRDDRRSWIDFYDGISNLTEYQREQAIVIRGSGLSEADRWTAGGSYLGFVRLGIDLQAWRTLNRVQQERMVGRDKLDGCPIVSFPADPKKAGSPIPGCTPHTVLGAHPPATFRDPPPLTNGDTTVAQSHMRRVNANRRPGPYSDPAKLKSFRIYRQGYPFLEPNPRHPTPFEARSGFRTGLNFVSFQSDPHRLIGILTDDGWLGGTNFGGQERIQHGSTNPLTAYAAGMFLVPPKVPGEPFPGATALGA